MSALFSKANPLSSGLRDFGSLKDILHSDQENTYIKNTEFLQLFKGKLKRGRRELSANPRRCGVRQRS